MSVSILNTNNILTYIQNFIKAKNPQIDIQPGTDLYDLIMWGNAQTVAKNFEELQNIENLQSIFTTFGSTLDLVAKNYNISRKKSVASIGEVTLFTNTFSTDIIIPDGTLVSTKGTIGETGTVFKTIGAATMLFNVKSTYFNYTTGRYEIDIPVQCTIAGITGNIDSDAISVVQTPVSQIQGVINVGAVTGGTNVESDGELQERCALSWVVSTIGTKDGYKKTLLDNREEVRDVLAIGPFETESVREGTDVYVITSSAAIIYTQTFNYDGGNYTILNNQPVLELNSVIDTVSSTMIEGVSYRFNKQFASINANSSIVDATNNRVDWIESLIDATVATGSTTNIFTYANTSNYITVKTDDAYLNTRVTFTFGGLSGVRTVIAFSYDTTTDIATFTLSGASGTIVPGNIFTLDPHPNLGDPISITYKYNADISDLQSYMEQDTTNVIGSDILIKNGLKGKFTLSLTLNLFSGYDFNTVKTKVESAIAQYMTNLKLGNSLQLSDLTVVTQTGQGTDYIITEVDYITIDETNTYFTRWDGTAAYFGTDAVILLTDKEYAVLETVNIV